MPTAKNRFGDALPKIVHRLDAATEARAAGDEAGARPRRVRAAGQRRQRPLIRSTSEGNYLDHPAGGCRMGTDPAASVMRQLRPHARSREPVRRRRADAADGRLHQRHADVCRADAAVRGSHRERPGRRPHGGTRMRRARMLDVVGVAVVAALTAACGQTGQAQAPAAAPAAAERPNPLPGVTKTMDQLQEQMFHVSAGRRLKPPSWPGNDRVAVALSFDVDNAIDGAVAGKPGLRGACRAASTAPSTDCRASCGCSTAAGAGVVLHPRRERRTAPGDGAQHPREAGPRDRHPRLDPRAAADLERREGRAAAARPVVGAPHPADGQAAGRLPGAVMEVQPVRRWRRSRRPASSTTAA